MIIKFKRTTCFFGQKSFTITLITTIKSSLLEKKVFIKFHSLKNRPDSKLLNGSVCVSCSPGNDYNSLKNIAVYLLIKSYINYMKCIVTTVNPHVAYFIWSSAGTSPSASRWKGCRQKSQTVGQAFYMLVEVHCQDMPDKTQEDVPANTDITFFSICMSK